MSMSSMRGEESSGIARGDDEDAWIEAEIQRELDALSPLSEGDLARSIEDEEEEEIVADEEDPPPNGTIPESVGQFLERVKSRARDAEQSLAECNDLLQTAQRESEDVEEFAYKSKALNEIAFQLGEDPEELRDRVIQELEEEEAKDAELQRGGDPEFETSGLALVPTLNEETGAVAVYTEINRFEQELVRKVQELEGKLHEREETEARDRREAGVAMAMLDRSADQHRRMKQEENDGELRRTAQERLVEQARMEEEITARTRQHEEEQQQHQHEIEELARQTALEKETFEAEWGQEVQRQAQRKQNAATTIQAAFRSHRVRKPYIKKIRMIREGLKERKENERQMDIVAKRKKEEQKKRKDKLEKMRKEEEERKRLEEEEKRKEEERKEIERLERVRIAKEKKEKERLEKERMKKEEEEKKKKEELDRQSEEILKRILPDRQKVEQKAIEGEDSGRTKNRKDESEDEAVNREGNTKIEKGSETNKEKISSIDKSNNNPLSNQRDNNEDKILGETIFITEKESSMMEEKTVYSESNSIAKEEQTGMKKSTNLSENQTIDSGVQSVSQHRRADDIKPTVQTAEQTGGNLDQNADSQKGRKFKSGERDGAMDGTKGRNEGRMIGADQKVADRELPLQTESVLNEQDLRNSKKPTPPNEVRESSNRDSAFGSKGNQTEIEKARSNKIMPLHEHAVGSSENLLHTSKTILQVPGRSNLTQSSTIHDERLGVGETAKQRSAGELNVESKSGDLLRGQRVLREHCPLEPDMEQRRLQWIQDCIPLTKLASRAKMNSTTTKARKQLRRPASAKKTAALTDEQIREASPNTALSQVTTVQLKDLPGCSLSSLNKCQRLRTLTLHSCGVSALEGLDSSPDILWIDVSHNKVESISCRDRSQLVCVDASWNMIGSSQGLEGCSQLRRLDLSHNKITRIAGLESLLSLTHLDLGHNQLVNVSGLSCLVHLQDLGLTANHLSSVRGLEQCPLLQRLDLSSNSLTQVPNLSNNVLLRSLSLASNSLSSLACFDKLWLPLLQRLDLSQNGLSEVVPLKSFLLLSHFSICNNFISDVECLIPGLVGCHQLQRLDISGNAVTEEPQHRDAILGTLPSLQQLDSDHVTPKVKGHEPSTTPSSFEVMCRSQIAAQDAMQKQHEGALKSLMSSGCQDLAVKRAELCAQHLQEIYIQAEEHRYMHEYGETSPVELSGETSASLADKKTLPPSTGDRPAASSAVAATNSSHKNTGNTASTRSATNVTTSTVDSVQAEKSETARNVEEKSSLKHSEFHQTPVGESSHEGQGSSNREAATKMALDALRKDSPQHKIQSKVSATGPRINARAVSEALQREKNQGTCVADKAAVLIQAQWRGFSVRRSIDLGTKQWLAALKIQSVWRGHKVRRRLQEVKKMIGVSKLKVDDPEDAEYAEIDLDSFEFNEDMLEQGWSTPSETPTLLSKYPPLPPTSHPSSSRPHPYSAPKPQSPLPTQPHPPSTSKPLSPEKFQPRPMRQAWRGADSPLSAPDERPRGYNDHGGRVGREPASTPEGRGGLIMRKPPLPPTTPSSLVSTEILSEGTPRTQRSSRQEFISEEWGFKDSTTADLMMRRAKKMAKGKKKKLDPIQRYQQIKKHQDGGTARPVQTNKKGVQRKDYFQAREEEEGRKVQSKIEESSQKQTRTFDWVHAQVNSHPTTDSRINQHGSRNRQSNSEPNLPAMTPDIIQGSRVSLVSPNTLEIQSVDSVSVAGLSARGRSHSFSSPDAGERVQFPPIKVNSAPSSHIKQRMTTQGGDRQGGGGVAWGGSGGRTGRGKNSR